MTDELQKAAEILVAKREDIDWQRDQLQDEGIEILGEIMI